MGKFEFIAYIVYIWSCHDLLGLKEFVTIKKGEFVRKSEALNFDVSKCKLCGRLEGNANGEDLEDAPDIEDLIKIFWL